MSSHSTWIVALAAAATLGAAPAARADSPQVRILPPHHRDPLPVFGMHTFNNGRGERVVRVRYGGLAWRLGLERGDTIVRLGRYPLRYHGSWEHALRRALRHGGHVDLAIIDVRTGRLVRRHVDLDGYGPGYPGPITPKSAPVATKPLPRHHVGRPVTPPQSRVQGRVLSSLREALRRP